MNFAETIDALERRGIMPDRPPDLEMMNQALSRCQFPQPTQGIILVAGTNGKGSTCAALEALLRHAGERTGFYSSPHLSHYGERIRLDGQPITELLFCEAYRAVEEKTCSLPLSHFEMLTLMAMWVFTCGVNVQPVDRIILEVGLGGTWDATNAIPHTTAVIASLDYDHQNLLGKTLPEIAKNKLGIVTPDTRNIIYQPFPGEILKIVNETKEKYPEAVWHEAPSLPWQVEPGHPPKYFLKYSEKYWANALAGQRGAENAALAVQTFVVLGYPVEKHLPALGTVLWPGRMEYLGKTKTGAPFYVSGDHNPQGIRSLKSLLPFYPRKKLFILVGIGKDKSRDEILTELFSLTEAQIILTPTPFRGLEISEYGEWVNRAAITFTETSEALTWLDQQGDARDMVLVTGSLYLVGKVRSILEATAVL